MDQHQPSTSSNSNKNPSKFEKPKGQTEIDNTKLRIETLLLLLEFLPNYLEHHKKIILEEELIELHPLSFDPLNTKPLEILDENAFNNLFWFPRKKYMAEILRHEFTCVLYPQYLFQQIEKILSEKDLSWENKLDLKKLKESLKRNKEGLKSIISFIEEVLNQRKQSLENEVKSREQDNDLLGYIETSFNRDWTDSLAFSINHWEQIFKSKSSVSFFHQLWEIRTDLQETTNLFLKVFFCSWLEIKLAFIKTVNSELISTSEESMTWKQKCQTFFSFWKEKIDFNFQSLFFQNTETSFIESLYLFNKNLKRSVFSGEINKTLELFLYSNSTSVATQTTWKKNRKDPTKLPSEDIIRARNYIYLINDYFFEFRDKIDALDWFLSSYSTYPLKILETIKERNNSNTRQQKAAKRSELIVLFKKFQQTIIRSEILIENFLYALSVLETSTLHTQEYLVEKSVALVEKSVAMATKKDTDFEQPQSSRNTDCLLDLVEKSVAMETKKFLEGEELMDTDFEQPQSSRNTDCLLDEETFLLAISTLCRYDYSGLGDKEFSTKSWTWTPQHQKKAKDNILSAQNVFSNLIYISKAHLDNTFALQLENKNYEKNVFFKFVEEFENALFFSQFTKKEKKKEEEDSIYYEPEPNEVPKKILVFLKKEVSVPSIKSGVAKEEESPLFYQFFLRLNWLHLEIEILEKNFEKGGVMFFVFLSPKTGITAEQEKDLRQELLFSLKNFVTEIKDELLEKFGHVEEIRVRRFERYEEKKRDQKQQTLFRR